MHFTYDEKKVSWTFNDTKYEYCVNGIRDAKEKERYIFIRSSEDDRFTYTHLTLEGKLILSETFSLKNDYRVVKILNEDDKEINFNIPNLAVTNVDISGTVFYAIIGERKIAKYSVHGKLLAEYLPPQGYKILSFFDSVKEEDVEFILDGVDTPEHMTGWRFSLNTITGEWKKLNSVRW